MAESYASETSFGRRLGTALACFWRILTSRGFCGRVNALLRSPEPRPAPSELAPGRAHASGLAVLSMLQREGRLIDFLQEDVAGFADAEVGAAARVVHAGCRKALAQHFTVEPVLTESENAAVTVPGGFDAGRIRLTGQVTGSPPFRGTLKHHGWVATAIRMPTVSEALDPHVLAPAEVEL